MICGNCGNEVKTSNQFCERCGAAVSTTGNPSPPTVTPGTESAPLKSGKATGSLIAGLAGFLFFPASIVAIVLGHMSRAEIRKSQGRLTGNGNALAGLILGYFVVAWLPVIVLIIAAIAIPNLLRAKIAANESSAVGSVRTVVMAEAGYRIAFPQSGYTCDLGSVSGVLASGRRNGYRFALQNCAADTYQIVAYPERYNTTGVRAFCADEKGNIRYDERGSADACLESGTPLH